MVSSSKKNLGWLRENLDISQQEIAQLFSVSEQEWNNWELGEGLADYKQITKGLLVLIYQGHLLINKKDSNALLGSLGKVKHLNEKLAETAIGPDVTIHQCIEDEILTVIKNIK
ncbi:hypothetical protein Q4503_16655 [Colwellia sp. 6_MG-2023]|uniref:helix-turn-helix domain-containing protein n=1 Tax=Colwellia sp. 6_MG-2023 TaxID=3062676 RepID=UPI0026E18595|nr:hypothetical protein [Colwellia sp. 6_MG-2023]MDO6489328.1 hypothetical protein [Colwellia sp. 6_MG-2023]